MIKDRVNKLAMVHSSIILADLYTLARSHTLCFCLLHVDCRTFGLHITARYVQPALIPTFTCCLWQSAGTYLTISMCIVLSYTYTPPQTVHLMCVLKGGTSFFQDLIHALRQFHDFNSEGTSYVPYTIDFIRAKSYSGTSSR
jgi:hypothetical protein